MAEGRKGGATHALADGIARVLSAPAVLAGVVVLVAFYGASDDVRHWIGTVGLWAFLSGGVLDRYARNRATRARGFFGACGAHLGAMLRLGLIVVLAVASVHAVIGPGFPNAYAHEAGFLLALVLTLVLSFAQVRVAVEDRRSAIGAFLGGARFVWRNPAALVLFAGFVAVALGVMLAFERVTWRGDTPTWTAWLLGEVPIAIESSLALAWLATAVSLFQRRLAHAGYTAGPPLTWPESPAAEAIANASPSISS